VPVHTTLSRRSSTLAVPRPPNPLHCRSDKLSNPIRARRGKGSYSADCQRQAHAPEATVASGRAHHVGISR
jgi:hypothetical protein